MSRIGIGVLTLGKEFDNVTPKYRTYFTVPKGTKLVPECEKHARTRGDLKYVKLCCLQELEEELKNDIPMSLFSHVHQFMHLEYMKPIELKPLVPYWDKLRHYQQVAVQKFLAQDGRMFLMDDMGTGKTIQAMACISALMSLDYIKTALVVVPSSLLFTWKSECDKWLPYASSDIFVGKETDQFNPKTKKKKWKFYRDRTYKVIIISYSILARCNIKKYPIKFDLLISDECHYTKTQTARRTQALQAFAKKAKYKLLMTGTACSYPAELWPQLRVLFPDMFPIFFDNRETDPENLDQLAMFAHRYGVPMAQRIKSRGFTTTRWEHKAVRNLDELNAILRSFMLRRTKKMVLKELPPKIRSRIILPQLTSLELNEIKEMIKVETSEDDVINEKDTFKFTQSCNLTNQLKLPSVLSFLKTAVIQDMLVENPDKSIIVFCHSKASRVAMGNLFDEHKITWCTVHGSMKPEDKAKAVEEFQSGLHQVILASIESAKVGLTLTRASTVIVTELRYSFDVHSQAEDRACRMGQKSAVNVMYLISPGTMDERCWSLINKKADIASQVLDGQNSYVAAKRIHYDESEDDFLKKSVFVARKQKKEVNKMDAYMAFL